MTASLSLIHRPGFIRLRARIAEPKTLTVVFALGHLVAFLTGLVTLNRPPQTIAGELGPVILTIWAGLLTLGGALGAIATLSGGWKWARWGVIMNLASIVIYIATLVILHVTSESGTRLTQIGFITLGLLLFVAQWVVTRGRSYAPKE